MNSLCPSESFERFRVVFIFRMDSDGVERFRPVFAGFNRFETIPGGFKRFRNVSRWFCSGKLVSPVNSRKTAFFQLLQKQTNYVLSSLDRKVLVRGGDKNDYSRVVHVLHVAFVHDSFRPPGIPFLPFFTLRSNSCAQSECLGHVCRVQFTFSRLFNARVDFVPLASFIKKCGPALHVPGNFFRALLGMVGGLNHGKGYTLPDT